MDQMLSSGSCTQCVQEERVAAAQDWILFLSLRQTIKSLNKKKTIFHAWP